VRRFRARALQLAGYWAARSHEPEQPLHGLEFFGCYLPTLRWHPIIQDEPNSPPIWGEARSRIGAKIEFGPGGTGDNDVGFDI
jgi:hypothetical protein